MTALNTESVQTVLAEIKDPECGRPITQCKQVHELAVDGNTINAKIGLTSFAAPIKADFEQSIRDLIGSKFSGATLNLEITEHQRAPLPLGQVGLTAKAVIAVGSGKGGVGKSTVSTSLALGLKRAGCKVGLMDADVYGPSIPQLTGVRGGVSKEGEKIKPNEFDGMPIMSIGFMVPADKAVIWRGPMLHSAITTFVRDTAWGELDYLIIDMPPGTGDVALSLSQMLPLTGSVVVCTPQEVALIDAVKAVGMFREVKIPVVGMVENMSTFVCPDTGKSYDIFGKGGAKQYAAEAKIPFLGEIPINIGVRERGDEGKTAGNFDDPTVAPYLEAMAHKLVTTLAQRAAESPQQQAQLPVLG
jgi:ATP-binding protein involved in chromosome partitioning